MTAQEARNIANSSNSQKAKEQLKTVLSAINVKANSGEFQIVQYFSLEKSVLQELGRLGYSCKEEYSPDPREGGYFTTISWA